MITITNGSIVSFTDSHGVDTTGRVVSTSDDRSMVLVYGVVTFDVPNSDLTIVHAPQI